MFITHASESIGSLGVGAVFLGVSGLFFWQALHYWRLRRTPLVVESSGRVSYGEQECCPAATVRAVRIVPDPQAEHGDCKVVIELTGGSLIPLPLPYFGAISQREVARSLAGELARALLVELLETA